VTELNNSDQFIDEFNTGLKQHLLEKLLVVVKIVGGNKFMFKIFPNVMGFRA